MQPQYPQPPQYPGQSPYGYQQAPTIIMRPSNNRRALKWVFGLFAALIMMLLGLVVLLLIASETGIAALVAAMIVGTIPVPLYIMLILWIDRYESEPLWMLAMAFFWGATIAVFIAYIINTVGAVYIARETGSIQIARFVGAIFFAPTVEESAKALVLFILFFWKKDEFDGVVDGFVYAGMVGLGFAMTENFQYYGQVIASPRGGLGSEAFSEIYLVRGMLAPFSHPLFTSMTGIGLGIAQQSKNSFVKFIMPLLGLAAAMFLHFLWNFSASLSESLADFLKIYTVIMIPIFCATLGTIFFALRREGRVVREHLWPDLQRGLFTQEEYNRLGSIRGRMGASMRAFTRGGFGIWRARMRFNQAASELAFHRRRVASGHVRDYQTAVEREAAYIQMLLDLRRRLGPH
jgi:RsiW-degrading membrane proteinase PrsW (M82 family)